MFFLLRLSLLILSLPLLGLSSRSTSLSPGFCVCRSRQYNTICWEIDLFSGFFVSSWMIVWVDGVNGCCRCLAGGRGCWLKGRNQVPSVIWIQDYSLHFHIHYIAWFMLRISWSMYCYFKLRWNGKFQGWFIYVRVLVGELGVGIILFLFFSFFELLLLFFQGWCMIVCCVCLIVPFLLSLSMVPLIRHS